MSISAHGAVFSFEAVPAGGFVEVGELGDVSDPGSMRNEFDVTTHNLDIDKWLLGVHRRDPLTITVFWETTISSHAALRAALDANTFSGFKMDYPDGDGWVGSGFVKQITRSQPVDGPQSANIVIRLSGGFYRNGVFVGS